MRNVFYDGVGSIYHWHCDEDGKRVCGKVPFRPFLYLECSEEEGELMGMFGTPVKVRSFKNDKERREFLKTYSGNVYLNLPPEQQFLLANYREGVSTKDPLKTFYFDIEIQVYKTDPFPNADKAEFPINAICLYDTDLGEYIAWGYGDYEPEDGVNYIKVENEAELLRSFHEYWTMDYPDLVVGWNSQSFDIPYIYNRIEIILGEVYARSLSPIKRIYKRERKNNFGQAYESIEICGISHLDDMELHDYMYLGKLPGRKLDVVAELFDAGRKLDHSGFDGFAEFAEGDHQKFMEYNVHDVRLMVNLEEKNHYIQTSREITAGGFTSLKNTLGKTQVLSGYLTNEALQEGIAVYTKHNQTKGERITGGHVRDPIIGVHEDFCCFDVASLYPSVIITCNISPETKVGRIYRENDEMVQMTLRGEDYKIKPEELQAFFVEHEICRSDLNILFDVSKVGILPSFLINLRKKRTDAKAKMKVLAKDGKSDSQEYLELGIYEQLIKVLLNSAYGALACAYFMWYDRESAESVTTTGRGMIKEAATRGEDLILEFASPEWKRDDLVVMGDTDSVAFTMKPLCDAAGVSFKEGTDNVSEGGMEIAKMFEEHLTDCTNEWARTKLASRNPIFEFEAEEFADIGIFAAKKFYAMRLLNVDEKKRYKDRGIATRKSNYPEPIKALLWPIVKSFLHRKTKKEVDDICKDAHNKFLAYPERDTVWRQDIKTFYKYSDKAKGFDCPKGTPWAARSAINFNNLVDVLELNVKAIEEAEKINVLLLNKNSYGIDTIGFSDEWLPPEIEKSFTVNKDLQWKKLMDTTIKSFYNAAGWSKVDVIRRSKMDSDDIMNEVFGKK